MQRPLPETPDAWLSEIEAAYADAVETKHFGELLGEDVAEKDLVHLAPLVSMKFRGLDANDKALRDRVVSGALANYVANTGPGSPMHDALQSRPKLAFALCYVTAHLVLDMIDENQADQVLDHCEEHLIGDG